MVLIFDTLPSCRNPKEARLFGRCVQIFADVRLYDIRVGLLIQQLNNKGLHFLNFPMSRIWEFSSIRLKCNWEFELPSQIVFTFSTNTYMYNCEYVIYVLAISLRSSMPVGYGLWLISLVTGSHMIKHLEQIYSDVTTKKLSTKLQ